MCVDGLFQTPSQCFLVSTAGQEQQNVFHAAESGMTLTQIADTPEEALWLGQGVQTVTYMGRLLPTMMAILTSP